MVVLLMGYPSLGGGESLGLGANGTIFIHGLPQALHIEIYTKLVNLIEKESKIRLTASCGMALSVCISPRSAVLKTLLLVPEHVISNKMSYPTGAARSQVDFALHGCANLVRAGIVALTSRDYSLYSVE
ncbi:hypothetical protein Tco_0251484 [Tanacetum coccineum]